MERKKRLEGEGTTLILIENIGQLLTDREEESIPSLPPSPP